MTELIKSKIDICMSCIQFPSLILEENEKEGSKRKSSAAIEEFTELPNNKVMGDGRDNLNSMEDNDDNNLQEGGTTMADGEHAGGEGKNISESEGDTTDYQGDGGDEAVGDSVDENSSNIDGRKKTIPDSSVEQILCNMLSTAEEGDSLFTSWEPGRHCQ